MILVKFRKQMVEMSFGEAMEVARDMSNDYIYFTLSQKIGEDFYRFIPKHVGSGKEIKDSKPEFNFNNYRWGYFIDEVDFMVDMSVTDMPKAISEYLYSSKRDKDMWDQEIDSPLNYDEGLHMKVSKRLTSLETYIRFVPNHRVTSGGYQYLLPEDYDKWHECNVCTGRNKGYSYPSR